MASSSRTAAPAMTPTVMPMRYSSLTGATGALQTKNMSSGFAREEKQTWWSRRTNNYTQEVLEEQRKNKRRRLLGEEPPEVEEDKRDEETNGHQDGVNGDDPAADETMDDESKERSASAKEPGFKATNGQSLAPDPSKVLVIHPGSRILRFGLASDNAPHEVPNVIARKLASPPTPSTSASSSTYDMDDSKQDILKLQLRERMRILKLRGTSGGSIAANEYNATVTGDELADEEDEYPITWTDVSSVPDSQAFVGEEALHLPDSALKQGWTLRYPYSQGSFNTTCYTSSREVLGDISEILVQSLRKYCNITERNYFRYSVILLLPDLFRTEYVKEMTDLLLRQMGFHQLIVHQESLAATFAAGLPSACVVDMGAQKISISCIDEGLVIPESRMLLNFGGDDLVTSFLSILKRISFPYSSADLSKSYDWELLQWLVEQCVVFNEHNFGVNLYEFTARRPGEKSRKYTMKMHDEVQLPTMSFFAPRVLDWESKTAPKPILWKGTGEQNADQEEIIDLGGGVTTQAMRRSVAHLTQPRAIPGQSASSLAVPGAVASQPDGQAHANGAAADTTMNEDTPGPDFSRSNTPMQDASVRDSSPAVSLAPKGTTPIETSGNTPAPASAAPQIDIALESSKLPLDVALCESICHSGSEDKIKRVTTNILVIGGIANMTGVGMALQTRLEPLLRARYPACPTPLVIPPSKLIDQAHMAWKGVSNLCKLDVVNEMWVRRDDWELMNLRALRDRSYFLQP